MVDLEKLKQKLESDHKSNKTFGQYVLLPALQNLMGAFALGVLIWILGYVWLGFTNPFIYPMFRIWTYLICGTIWSILTAIYTFMDEVRIISALIIVYNMGHKTGLKSNKINSSNTTNKTLVKETQPSRGRELLEDVNKILTWSYQTGKNISRDSVLEILKDRENSKKSAESALEFMYKSGLIKKGLNRNDPIETVFDSYKASTDHLRKYLKDNK